jgi:hypothetical protein
MKRKSRGKKYLVDRMDCTVQGSNIGVYDRGAINEYKGI